MATTDQVSTEKKAVDVKVEEAKTEAKVETKPRVKAAAKKTVKKAASTKRVAKTATAKGKAKSESVDKAASPLRKATYAYIGAIAKYVDVIEALSSKIKEDKEGLYTDLADSGEVFADKYMSEARKKADELSKKADELSQKAKSSWIKKDKEDKKAA